MSYISLVILINIGVLGSVQKQAKEIYAKTVKGNQALKALKNQIALIENETFDSGDTASDQDYSFLFTAGLNGTFDYFCEPHRSVGMVGQIIVNPLPPAENNTTEDPVIDEMMDDESYMPFISLPSITAVIAAAVLFRTEEELF